VAGLGGLFAYGTTQFGGTGYDGASPSGNGVVFRLTVPMFLSSSFTQAVATIGQAYSGSALDQRGADPGDLLTPACASAKLYPAQEAPGTLSHDGPVSIGPTDYTTFDPTPTKNSPKPVFQASSESLVGG